MAAVIDSTVVRPGDTVVLITDGTVVADDVKSLAGVFGEDVTVVVADAQWQVESYPHVAAVAAAERARVVSEGRLRGLDMDWVGAAPSGAPLVVEGPPRAKGRPRVTMHGTYTEKSTREAEERIAWSAKAAGMTPLDGPVGVLVEFSTDHRRVDLDNLAKLVLDALNGVAWQDDRQIHDLHVIRLLDRPQRRTVVWVWPLTPQS